ncbi:hypothetical protein TWF718_005340 [Orbilia javanica]|uniref:Uncharacterized protein n=1 Tax=Orbilia javanica TaxID=47235 RepID=A0AAN8RIR9_9PEZI
MSNANFIAISLVLSRLFSFAAAQRATAFSFTSYETTPLATYSFGGSLTSFYPPAACTKGDFWSVETEPLSISGTQTRQYIWSYFSAGCHSDSPRSCCPTDWRDTVYYTSTGGLCPPGYSRMPYFTGDSYITDTFYYYPVISLSSGSSIAIPCCPTVTYTHIIAPSTGLLRPRVMLTSTITTSGSSYVKILCDYLQSDNLETFTRSSTSVSIFYLYVANPIYIFDDDAIPAAVGPGETTTTPVSSPNTLPPTPGTSATSGTSASDTSTPINDGDEKKSSLSTGAIAGIAVGVGVPLIAIAIYLTYRFTRKGSGASGSPWGSSGKTEVGAMEPGIMENPAEYGGINSGGAKTYN